MSSTVQEKKRNVISNKLNNQSRKSSILKVLTETAILSLLIVLIQAIVQNGFEIMAYVDYIISPLILVLNFLPVFLILLISYMIFKRQWVGYLIVNIPLSLALTISEFKIYFRDDPLKPIDVLLFNESANIIQNYKLVPRVNIILLFVLLIALFVYLIKNRKPIKIGKLTRTLGIVVSITCLVLSYIYVYSNGQIYKNIRSHANEYYDVDLYKHKGFILSFLSGISTVTYPKPEGYSVEKANNIIKENNSESESDNVKAASTDGVKMPNVIAVMSEAFFDPQVGKNVSFYPGMNPLTNLNQMKKEAYHGNIIVPGFAGSTESTEFEFLTGANLSLMSESLPTAYKSYINRDIYSLTRYFKNDGYETKAIHPGHGWFYNRENVYKRMGFDNFITEEDLPANVEKVNFYTSDKVTSDLIIDNYKKHLSENKDQGYFNFNVTIQNHGPYRDYDAGLPKRYVRPDGISDANYNIINNYMNGLYDADQLIGRVKDYLKSIDEPTVFVFFGDHLPYLDADFTCYDYLGYNVKSDSIEGIQNRYKIPYFIWCNDAAKKLIKQNGSKVKVGEGKTISANFLAGEMFDVIGVDPKPYFSFVNSVKDKISVISPAYDVVNGKVVQGIPAEFSGLISNYKTMQYYNLHDYYKYNK